MSGIERLTYSPVEAAGILGICVNGVYKMLKSRQLNGVRVGRKIIIPKAEIQRLLSCSTPCYNRHPLIADGKEIEL